MLLYNTLSRKTEVFVPIERENGKVHLYHCGPTVYDYAHIGNLRSYVFADTLRRTLEFSGHVVKQVINITDVGHLTNDTDDSGADKIEKGAEREHKTIQEIIALYSDAFFDDLKKLNIKTTETIFPRATTHIDDQINLILILEKKGYTYKTSDGLYFDTSLFKNYGTLGQINLNQLEEGARVAKNPEKRNPTDFALWKFSKPTENRKQEWASPWGTGFPGWHIECSAMSMHYLGETFDLHTGGIDHIPVHHNNEIAQSESATGKPYVHYWLHNEFVNIAGEAENSDGVKMSKSKENFLRLTNLEEHGLHPLAYRYWLLTAHYRSPIAFSFTAVEAAQTALESLVRKIGRNRKNPNLKKCDDERFENIRAQLQTFIDKDLDTPASIAFLHETVDTLIKDGIDGTKTIEQFDSLLGLNLISLSKDVTEVPEAIQKLLEDRENFRQSSDFKKADEIRAEIEKQGFTVDDTSTGSLVYRQLFSLISAHPKPTKTL